MPLLPPAERSVLTDYLEREVPTNTVYDYGEPTQSFELVWPTGEILQARLRERQRVSRLAVEGCEPFGPGPRLLPVPPGRPGHVRHRDVDEPQGRVRHEDRQDSTVRRSRTSPLPRSSYTGCCPAG